VVEDHRLDSYHNASTLCVERRNPNHHTSLPMTRARLIGYGENNIFDNGIIFRRKWRQAWAWRILRAWKGSGARFLGWFVEVVNEVSLGSGLGKHLGGWVSGSVRVGMGVAKWTCCKGFMSCDELIEY
jgi:hypothetical protein